MHILTKHVKLNYDQKWNAILIRHKKTRNLNDSVNSIFNIIIIIIKMVKSPNILIVMALALAGRFAEWSTSL